MVADILLPELVDRLLHEAQQDIVGNEDDEKHQQKFIAYLIGVSQVSRIWYQQTRPYLFNRLRIKFGTKLKGEHGKRRKFRTTIRRILGKDDQSVEAPPPTHASRRIEGFLDLIASAPALGSHVRKLVITGEGEHANQDLKQCNSALVALLEALHLNRVSCLRIGWEDDQRPTGEEHHWWSEELDEPSRSLIRRMVELPHLTKLDLCKVMLPPSVWMANTSIRWLTLWERAIFEEQPLPPQRPCPAPHTLSLISDDVVYSCIPTLIRIPHLPLLSALTGLIITMGVPWLEDIQRVLSIVQGTLSQLTITLYMYTEDHGEKKIDLSALHALKELSLCVISVQVTREVQSKFIAQSLPTLSWKQLEILALRPRYRCPETEHTRFDPLPALKHVDDVVSARTFAANATTGKLRTLGIYEDMTLCDPCFAAMEALPPSTWHVSVLAPKLHALSNMDKSDHDPDRLGLCVVLGWYTA